jgi:hypothetical protein
MMSEPIRYEHAERVRDFYRNQGVAKERERIIELLQQLITSRPDDWELLNKGYTFETLIALIKGETK